MIGYLTCTAIANKKHGSYIACIASIYIEELFCILAAGKLGLLVNWNESKNSTTEQ